MYYYKLYGLIIASELIFPQLIAAHQSTQIDLYIKYGSVPESLMNYITQTQSVACFTDNTYWMRIPNGYMIIPDQHNILIALNESINIDLLRSYILGYGIAFSFLFRNLPAVHSSSVTRNQKSIIFMGNSGSGKSSLTSVFLEHGYQLVADDITIIDTQSPSIIAYPGAPMRKLCRDAALREHYDVSTLHYIDNDKDKFAINACDNFCTTPCPIIAIFLISPEETNNVTISLLEGQQKLMTFLNNLFLKPFFKKNNIPPLHMKKCLDVIAQIPIYTIHRPNNGLDTTREQMEQILSILNC